MKKELAFSKNGMLLLLVLASGILFSGCRKDRKNPIQFEINAYMPHTNEPVTGIKWKVSETKYQGWPNGHTYTGWDIEGTTDASGQSKSEFIPYKNTDYTYIISFDYSEASVQGETNLEPKESQILQRGYNNIELRILPKMDIQFHYLNTSCYNSNDIFRYKSANIDDKPNHNFNSQAWNEPSILEGCCDYNFTSNRLAGRYVYIWEAVRNGITETGVDTFLVSPGINSTINMHW